MNWRGLKGGVSVISLKGEEVKVLLGITKSGTSAKGEMRLVPKPAGTWGGLEYRSVVSGAFSSSGESEINPLYSFR